jgi:hypothetical protein
MNGCTASIDVGRRRFGVLRHQRTMRQRISGTARWVRMIRGVD